MSTQLDSKKSGRDIVAKMLQTSIQRDKIRDKKANVLQSYSISSQLIETQATR